MKKPKLVASMAILYSLLLTNEVFSHNYVLVNNGNNTTNIANDIIFLSLRVKNSDEKSLIDSCKLSYTEGFSRENASKTENSTENISLVSNGLKYGFLERKKTITQQPDTINISLGNLFQKKYILTIDPSSFDKSQKIYFVNKKNNTIKLIDASLTFEYEFQAISGEKTINDFFIVIGGTSSPMAKIDPQNKLVIYPDLSKEEITFSVPKDEKLISIKIIDVNGMKNPVKLSAALNNKVSISHLKKGNYWIEVETEKTTRIANFLKY
jgi:hypothetical protein